MEESKKISAKRTLVSPLYWGRSLNKPPPLKIRASWTRGLSSAEAPVGYPYKNSNNRKNTKRAEEDGKRKKAGSSLLSSPSHRAPRAVFFFLPSFPTTQSGLCAGDWEELGCISGMAGLLKVRWKTWKTKRSFVATWRNDLSISL